ILWRRGRGYPLTHAHNIVGVVDCYRVCVFVLFFPPFNQLLQLVALQGEVRMEPPDSITSRQSHGSEVEYLIRDSCDFIDDSLPEKLSSSVSYESVNLVPR
ncbi:hypothetical protein GBAR_LOCUS25045, partial [Geodia barretti]